MKNFFLISIILLLTVTFTSAQNNQEVKSGAYLRMRWEEVAMRMPSSWYGSDEAKLVAENVLISQKEIGGWAKNEPYHHIFSDSLKAHYMETKAEKGGTFDNGSTLTELRFLAKVYSSTKDERYKQAFEKGLNYIFSAQYKNGGWPQYYPVKDPKDEILLDKTEPYSMHITYNDDAIVNIMTFLKEIFSGNEEFASLIIDKDTKLKAKKTFDKGVECILKTQIVVDNKRTVWCAQHNEKTLLPANARAYELASFSGSESVGIVLLLMNIDNPSKSTIASINGAVKWFEDHKIEGIKIGSETDNTGRRNRIVVEDKNAPPIWGRFHDLETGKPFFCSRDGIKRNSMAEISSERRNGYSWYTYAPQRVLTKYPEWQQKWTPNENILK
jgi:PelA/Pel-15E family pectate lyase